MNIIAQGQKHLSKILGEVTVNFSPNFIQEEIQLIMQWTNILKNNTKFDEKKITYNICMKIFVEYQVSYKVCT